MITQNQSSVSASGQNVQRFESNNRNGNMVMPFIINGCTVSVTATPNTTTDPILAIKEILLSSYRTSQVKV